MSRSPTFELLREKRELAVVNPANGVRFKISLRDWQGALWAVRVHPQGRREPWNPFTTAHRLMPRERIESWLGGLRLSRSARRRTPSSTNDWKQVVRHRVAEIGGGLVLGVHGGEVAARIRRIVRR